MNFQNIKHKIFDVFSYPIGLFMIFMTLLLGNVVFEEINLHVSPKIGNFYTSDGSPFDINKRTNLVIDIKDGWVLYKNQFSETNWSTVFDFNRLNSKRVNSFYLEVEK